MYEDIKVKLNPYLGCSNNLMEFFVVIGYEEELLNEFIYNILNGEDKDKLRVSIVSSDISDLELKSFNPDYIIDQVYPVNPEIIQSNSNPKSSNVVFYSCFDSLDGKKKIFYSCYGLKFYEKYIDISKNEYFIPKTFLILSQYPYYSTYKKICELALEYVRSDVVKKIPIEILMHCLINHIPSPINNSLFLNDFSPTIYIPKLTGYPYIDFDLCKIFNIIPIKEFIKIFIMIFLEIDLLIFSPELEKLNIFMYILLILNYPLIDSNYYWFVRSISLSRLIKMDIESENKKQNFIVTPSFIGVNTEFNWDIKMDPEFKIFNFCINMEDMKNIINPINLEVETKEINQLLNYIHNILNHNKIEKSFFLNDYVLILKKKLKAIFQDYAIIIKGKTNDSFFYINEEINKINRRIQEAFYDFILNILVILYKDFEVNNELTTPIKKRKYINPHLSDEEKIFLKYYRRTIKYNTYFENFLTYFESMDEIKIALLFSDEYVNLKMKDINKNIPEHIKYFDIMDKIYSLKPQIQKVNFNSLFEEYKKNNRKNDYKKIMNITSNNTTYIINKNNKQLFSFERDLIRLFIFYNKNRDCYKAFKKEKEINAEIIVKMSIPFTILNYFDKILNPEYYIRSSLIYIFSLIFPLLSFQDSLNFLNHILKNLQKVKFFQRYYLYIILKSIYKYYILNQEFGQFPQFIPNNAKNYCQLINAYLIDNLINPNEEIFGFFKKIYALKDEGNKSTPNGIYKDNLYVFHNKEKDFIKNINSQIVIKEDEFLIYYYQGIAKKCHFLKKSSEVFHIISSIHDDFFNVNFSLENLNFKGITEVIINVIYYLHIYREIEIVNLLTNVIILLKIVGNNIYDYKEKKKNNNI